MIGPRPLIPAREHIIAICPQRNAISARHSGTARMMDTLGGKSITGTPISASDLAWRQPVLVWVACCDENDPTPAASP
jgi:hypothetical protein